MTVHRTTSCAVGLAFFATVLTGGCGCSKAEPERPPPAEPHEASERDAPSEVEDQLFRLASDASSSQEAARAWFRAMGKAAVPDLVAGLDDRRLGSIAHGRILRLLSEIGDERALPAVLAASHRAEREHDHFLLQEALLALGAFSGKEAVDELIRYLSAPDRDVVKQAAIVLGQVRSPAAVEPLGRLLESGDAGVRYCAAGSLRATGGGRALEILKSHAEREKDPEVLRQIRGESEAGDP